jgi:hypothetical protein
MLPLDRRALRPARAAPAGPRSREGEQRPLLGERKPGRRLAGSGRGVFAEAGRGTRQRFLAESQLRQCGLETLRTLVTGWLPYCGGPGMPQRAIISSRSPSALLRTIGAIWSGKRPGNSGRLPVRSCLARNQSRMAAWPLVKE